MISPLVWPLWGRVVAAAAALGVAGLVASPDDGGLVVCPFRRCTGGYCPGCGITRASGALVRGDVVGSWQRHPMLLLGMAQAAVIVPLLALAGDRVRPWIDRWLDRWLALNLLALLGIWIGRLLTGSIPAPFS